MTDPEVVTGQAGADSTGTTATAPQGGQGQSVASGQTTGDGPDAAAGESFFDPASVKGKPELEAAYKQMQGAFTKRMQSFKASEEKARIYDQFQANPVGTLRQLAAQYGLNIADQAQEKPSGEWQPQTWDEVIAQAEQRAEKRILEKLSPVLNEVQQLKSQSMEQFLDTQHPDWRVYEQDMLKLLEEHPTLAKSPSTLYRMAVPENVLTSRATKAALEKLQTQNNGSQVAGSSKTTKTATTKPNGPLSFDDAVRIAKAKLNEEGIRP